MLDDEVDDDDDVNVVFPPQGCELFRGQNVKNAVVAARIWKVHVLLPDAVRLKVVRVPCMVPFEVPSKVWPARVIPVVEYPEGASKKYKIAVRK